MKKTKIFIAGLVAAILLSGRLAAQAPTVSEKKDVAVFSLGYYGWAIPLETLGSIDQEIQKVFVDLGRFNYTRLYRTAILRRASTIHRYPQEVQRG